MLLTTAYMPLAANWMPHRQPSKVTPMLDDQLPLSDLEKLARDVLGQPPTAALPCNLSDEWLALIARDLDACMGEMTGDTEGAPSAYMAAPLALVIHLLHGKANGQDRLIEFDAFEKYLDDYKLEINLEQVTRKTNISIQQACLNDIFDDRTVVLEEKHGKSASSDEARKKNTWASFLSLDQDADVSMELYFPRTQQETRNDPFSDDSKEGCEK
jgi:hypothetical protein